MTDDGIDRTCGTLGIAAPDVCAILTVETRGFGFLKDRLPLILFEHHWFHKLTHGKYDARNPDIGNKDPGGYVGGPQEYKGLKN